MLTYPTLLLPHVISLIACSGDIARPDLSLDPFAGTLGHPTRTAMLRRSSSVRVC